MDKLRGDGFFVTGYWFNPNIHPYKEYLNRLETLKLFAKKVSLELVAYDEYNILHFMEMIRGKEAYRVRCERCYLWRLTKAVEYAAKNGYEFFTTTLLYSKYQAHDKVKEICEDLSSKFGVKFYYDDFRKGWLDGIRMSRQFGLYRQSYCGCILSEEEALRDRRMVGDLGSRNL